MGAKRCLLFSGRFIVIPLLIQIARMFVVVTIDAQQFPVAAVRRVIFVVVVLVVNR